MKTTFLRHVKTDLAVHELQQGSGRPLLVLHGLGERTLSSPPSGTEHWVGPIIGLDFTGHGQSSLPAGGGYTCEALMSDADAVIHAFGDVTIFGRGLGGYIGLLLAGSRPKQVRGLVIADGPGLDGGGSRPSSSKVFSEPPAGMSNKTPDPWALLELSSDTRPGDYATEHVIQFAQLSGLKPAIAVASIGRPEWLEKTILNNSVVTQTDIAQALALFQ
ncbi:MAG TPA: alpha/beta hydrolase [Acidimicrobiaceae bacterium]|jgi:pimeloyl-ACP methyl ester carboxylesterase|nr:alpha/beta hydrolase [Actinomycetota bacterium]HAN08860.1 alpha/beta hydrolase [Acidimicrobiaceae bacterium]